MAHLLYLVALGLAWLPLVLCQTTTLSASSNTIAYIVKTEDGSQPRPIIWSNTDFQVTTTEFGLTNLVGGYSERYTEVPYSCDLDDILLASATSGTSTYLATESCASGCASVDVIPTWPSGGDTWTYYVCMDHLRNIDPSSLTIYRVVPPITTTESSSTESTSSTSATSQSTNTGGSDDDGGSSGTLDEDDEDNDNGGGGSGGGGGGPSTGVIVGAVVGGVVGVALVVVAFWLGLRHARRRAPDPAPEAAMSVAGTGTETTGYYKDTMTTAVGPTSPVAWTYSPPPPPHSDLSHSPHIDIGHQQQQHYKTVTSPAPTYQDTYSRPGASPPGELAAVPLSDPTVYEISATPRP